MKTYRIFGTKAEEFYHLNGEIAESVEVTVTEDQIKKLIKDNPELVEEKPIDIATPIVIESIAMINKRLDELEERIKKLEENQVKLGKVDIDLTYK